MMTANDEIKIGFMFLFLGLYCLVIGIKDFKAYKKEKYNAFKLKPIKRQSFNEYLFDAIKADNYVRTIYLMIFGPPLIILGITMIFGGFYGGTKKMIDDICLCFNT